MTYRNHEGYADETAGKAIREADKQPEEVSYMVKAIKDLASKFGYEIVGRIAFRDKATKREWR